MFYTSSIFQFWFYSHTGKGNYQLHMYDQHQGQIFTKWPYLRQHVCGVSLKSVEGSLLLRILKTYWGDKEYTHGKMAIMFGNKQCIPYEWYIQRVLLCFLDLCSHDLLSEGFPSYHLWSCPDLPLFNLYPPAQLCFPQQHQTCLFECLPPPTGT